MTHHSPTQKNTINLNEYYTILRFKLAVGLDYMFDSAII